MMTRQSEILRVAKRVQQGLTVFKDLVDDQHLAHDIAVYLVDDEECPIRSKDGFEVEPLSGIPMGFIVKPIDYEAITELTVSKDEADKKSDNEDLHHDNCTKHLDEGEG